MGGKALLPQVPDLKRLTKSEHNTIAREVQTLVSRATGLYASQLQIVPSYSAKTDFGDIDFIVSDNILVKDWVELVKNALKSTAVVHTPNSKVTSFEYKKYQIDIIVEPPESYDFAYNYYSYNDLGSLIGKIAKSMGFKFKDSGLYIEVREGTQYLGEVCVTKNFQAAIDLLGFRVGYYGYSLNKLEDIFKYVVNSTYFDKESFLLENANHHDRSRDPQRPNYVAFLEYINKPEIKSKHTFLNSVTTPWVAQLKKNYPDVVKSFSAIKEKHKFDRMISRKFNGHIVGDITGLSGPELGNFLTAYRHTFKMINEFDTFILSSGPDTIKTSIEKFHPTWVIQYNVEKVKLAKAEKARIALEAKLKKESAELARMSRSDGKIQGSFKEEAKLVNKSPAKKRTPQESYF